MPLAKAIVRLAAAAAMLAAASCSTPELTPQPIEEAVPFADRSHLMPRQIRTGTADMIIARVEREVSQDEVATAVRALVADAPVCFPWPSVWLQGNEWRTVFLVRYDLMGRDWGSDVSTNYRRRMQEFVELGFLTARERPEVGPGVVAYTLTREGDRYLRGSPYAGSQRPTFCAPAQRSLVAITSMEWGQYPCGTLRVRFTHVADAWPAWASSASTRDRVEATYGALGLQKEGVVTLGRQWFARGEVPADMAANGDLRSLCYDDARENIVGTDLDLDPAPEPQPQ